MPRRRLNALNKHAAARKAGEASCRMTRPSKALCRCERCLFFEFDVELGAVNLLQAHPGRNSFIQGIQVLGAHSYEGALSIEYIDKGKLAHLESTYCALYCLLRGRQQCAADRVDFTSSAFPLLKCLLGFRAQAEFCGIAQIPRLVSSLSSGQNIALVTVEQRNRHRQAEQIDALAKPFVVLAANTDGEVWNALRLFEFQGRLGTLDVRAGQP